MRRGAKAAPAKQLASRSEVQPSDSRAGPPQRHADRTMVWLLASALVACGGASDAGNQPPVAELAVDATLKVVGDPFELDASRSADPDGVIALYRFVFADGSPALSATSPTATHAYPRTGVYQLQLVVADDDGAEARAQATVTVISPECEDASCCLPEETFCPGEGCVNFDYDERNCGRCGRMCEVCELGECRGECAPGWMFCPDQVDGACTDVASDPDNCGGCGRICPSGACDQRECVP